MAQSWSDGNGHLRADPRDPDFPRRHDPDGEFCDDPDCDDCSEDCDDGEDEWEDEWEEDTAAGGVEAGSGQWARTHATMMHPSARCETVRVGLLPRIFAEFLSLVFWWAFVLVGFFVAMLLYRSPPAFLLIGLMIVPLIGETALTAEFGATPGKFLVGLRVEAGGSKPGWSRAIIRTFVIVAPFLPMFVSGPVADMAFIMGNLWLVVLMVSILADKDKRGFHDRIAGTSVVSKVRLRY